MKAVTKYFPIMVLALFISCRSGSTRLNSHVNEEYQVLYKQDTIFIRMYKHKTNDVSEMKLININGEYYIANKNDTILYLSNKKKCDFIYNDGSESYRLVIDKLNSGLSSSTNYLVNNKGLNIYLTTVYYDRKYQIKKFEIATTVEFW